MGNTKDKAKSVFRLILRGVWAIAMLAYFPIMMSFVADEKAEIACQRVETKVLNNATDVLITDKGLARIVAKHFPGIMGTKADDVNLQHVEAEIEKAPVVKQCEAYFTPGGVLHVEILQREPIMHVFKQTSSFYMDETAFIIEAERDMRANCVVVNGSVGSMLDADYDNLISLCKFINDSEFWKSQIEQVFVTPRREYMLAPRVGDHIVEFGNIDDYEGKFARLYALYTKGWSPNEWNKYKTVNLKYKGQVVCTKR